jgi:hypothetical protein
MSEKTGITRLNSPVFVRLFISNRRTRLFTKCARSCTESHEAIKQLRLELKWEKISFCNFQRNKRNAGESLKLSKATRQPPAVLNPTHTTVQARQLLNRTKTLFLARLRLARAQNRTSV